MVDKGKKAIHYTISGRVLTQSVHEEIVLLDLESEQYFGLNAVGAIVWQGLAAGDSLGAVHASVVDRYDVTEDQAWTDIDRLVNQLLGRGLISEAS